MNKLKLIALSLLPLMAAACTKSNTSQDPEPPSEPTPPVVIPSDPVPDGVISDITRSSIDNVNAFGLDLLKRSLGNEPGNRCMSPVSISAVLAMLANGDTRGSRDEILSVLGFNPGEEGLADLNFFNKTMLSCLPTLDPSTTYSFTNSYWHDPRVIVRDDYAARIADVMFASVFNQTPGGVEGMQAVNKFVEENTNGLIKDFIQEPLNITSACLNTIYFKGEWNDPFSEEVTHEDDFLNIDGTVSKAMFMRKMGVEYAETEEGTRAVRLPYGNGSFYMTAILPSDKINHVPLLECLDDDLLEKSEGGSIISTGWWSSQSLNVRITTILLKFLRQWA